MHRFGCSEQLYLHKAGCNISSVGLKGTGQEHHTKGVRHRCKMLGDQEDHRLGPLLLADQILFLHSKKQCERAALHCFPCRLSLGLCQSP